MLTIARTWRIVSAMLIFAALIGNAYKHVTLGYFAFFDTYGYFSQQSNILAIVVLLIALPRTGQTRPVWIEYARASVATYLVVVTAVYWLLLGGFEDGDPVIWSTAIMHGGACALLLADWLLEGPKKEHPIRHVWVVLLYPVLWITVVLIRGATDGWAPYPFLEPETGYASIGVIVASMLLVGTAIGAVLFRLTRWRVVTPD